MIDFAGLWNCREDCYSSCSHPVLQRGVDYVKNIYILATAQEVLPGIREIDMDIHLQRRRVGRLLDKFLKSHCLE